MSDTKSESSRGKSKQKSVPAFSEPVFAAGYVSSRLNRVSLEDAIDFDTSQQLFQKLQVQDPTPAVTKMDTAKPHKKAKQAEVTKVSNGQHTIRPQPDVKSKALLQPHPTTQATSTATSSRTHADLPDWRRKAYEDAAAQDSDTSSDDEEELQRELMEKVQRNLELSLAAYRAEKAAALAKVHQDRKQCQDWITSAPVHSSRPMDFSLALGRQVSGFWKASRPTTSVSKERQQVIAALQTAIDRRWPGQKLQVAAFGSSVTGLVTETSDLDLVLLDPTRPHGVGTPAELIRPSAKPARMRDGLPDWYRVYNIADAIRESRAFTEVTAIAGANVPIVKMIHKASKLPADLNINERFGLFNSRMISAYANLQPEIVRPLIFFLKRWFQARGLNDPSGKSGLMSFSSYTIALLAIQFLQVEGVLPNLQDASLVRSLSVPAAYLWSRPRQTGYRRKGGEPTRIIPAKKYDVTFATTSGRDHRQELLRGTPLSDDKQVADVIDRKLGTLLLGFFRYYGQRSVRDQVISIVNGRPVNRQRDWDEFGDLSYPSSNDTDEYLSTMTTQGAYMHALARQERDNRRWENSALDGFRQPDDWEHHEMIVQDPFILDRNTARNIKLLVLCEFEAELRRAHLILVSHNKTSRSEPERYASISDLLIPTTIIPTVDYERNAEASANLSVSDNPAGSAASEHERDEIVEQEIAAKVLRLTSRAAKKTAKARKTQAKKSRKKAQETLQSQPSAQPEAGPSQTPGQPKKISPPDSWLPSGADTSFSFKSPSPARTPFV